MNDQYFTREPSSVSRPAACTLAYRGSSLRFTTDAGVFSRGEVDEGTRLLLETLPPLTGRVLDLGCGWGAIGIPVAAANPSARVTMVDVNLRALGLAQENAAANGLTVETLESDGFSALSGRTFDHVLTNPPIRAGKTVIYRFFQEAGEPLSPEGDLFLVIRKQQGAESAFRYLQTIFRQVERLDRDKGFWVIRAAGGRNAADS